MPEGRPIDRVSFPNDLLQRAATLIRRAPATGGHRPPQRVQRGCARVTASDLLGVSPYDRRHVGSPHTSSARCRKAWRANARANHRRRCVACRDRRDVSGWRAFASVGPATDHVIVEMYSKRTVRLTQMRLRLSCAWRTRGQHELDIAKGRCKYCKRDWNELYPSTRKPRDAGER